MFGGTQSGLSDPPGPFAFGIRCLSKPTAAHGAADLLADVLWWWHTDFGVGLKELLPGQFGDGVHGQSMNGDGYQLLLLSALANTSQSFADCRAGNCDSCRCAWGGK